jgi:tight adherence protein B
MKRLVAAVAAVVALSVSWTTSALAQEAEGRITGVQVQDGRVQVGFATPVGSIEQDSVVLSLNGEQVPAEVESLAASQVRRTAVLAIDASNSMRGQPIENAKAAARSFLTGVPDETLVGLVTFNRTATVDVPPTLDRDEVAAAIDAISLRRQTALYDGVAAAVEAAGLDGFRSVVLLSDGRNVGGTATLDEAVSAVEGAGVSVDAVSFGRADIDALTDITDAGNGSLLRAEQAADIVTLFEEQAASVTNEVVVNAEIPSGLEGTAVNVAVTADAAGQQVSAEAVYALSPSGTPAPSPQPAPDGWAFTAPGFVSAAWFLPAAVGVVFIGLLALVAIALLPLARRRESAVTKRMSVYTLSQRGATEVERTEATRSSAVATQAIAAADVFVQSRGLEPSLEKSLTAAALPFRPAEWVLIQAGAAVGGGLLLLLISSFNPWWMLAGVALGIIIPILILRIRKSQRRNAFEAQLPDTLTLMAGSLAAGYSLPQAVDTVVREGREPVAGEMSKALVEARLGVPIEETLENVAERTQSKDFAWVVMAIAIQRQVGGNLSEILRIVAETLRERAYLRRQIKTLSAEGRLSAVIIAALPPLFLLYLVLVRPDYATLLFTDPLGIIMLVVAVVLQVLGVLWMRKIVNFEV